MGKKIGMTQIFDEGGVVTPVTVIQVEPNVVVQKKTVEVDGYNAIQVAVGEVKDRRVNKPMKGHFDKASVAYKKHLGEFRTEDVDSYNVGDEIKVDIFQAGEFVDVTGTSKGKGTQGVIKRHGFARGRETHGSKFHRMPGGMGLLLILEKYSKVIEWLAKWVMTELLFKILKLLELMRIRT